MSFETRQDARRRLLDRIMFAAKVFGVFYMALHVSVVALAYKLSGLGEAFLTLLTLGLGDLYWAVTWMREAEHQAIALVAGIAATACFTSWIGRPFFNQWAHAMTADMLADTAHEIDAIIAERRAEDPPPSTTVPPEGMPPEDPSSERGT